MQVKASANKATAYTPGVWMGGNSNEELTSVLKLRDDDTTSRPSREEEASLEDGENGKALCVFKDASWDDLLPTCQSCHTYLTKASRTYTI